MLLMRTFFNGRRITRKLSLLSKLSRRNLNIASLNRPNLGIVRFYPQRYSKRNYGTGAGFIPKGFFFRIFWTGTTATLGYVYYQVNQATSWMSEKAAVIKELGLETIFGFLDTWDYVATTADDIAQWNPFKWKSKAKTNDGSSHKTSNSDDNSSNNTDNTNSTNGLEIDGSTNQFKDFIKRMIEIRNILKTAEMESSLNLPSIVVIGSQSSGKSSVLENIVGHEFLPKGNNMITRRPLELTLVNSPGCTKDYAVFDQLETGPIYDFAQVQKTLTDLNLAVPENQWISEKPIFVTIYSKNVPDLSLVDLPGYIQIHNKNQPPILREKISKLCEKYIKEDNIILAVCPADVDLANAEALKASRTVDPYGQRTIGVITKLDLVDPQYSTQILKNEDYPLRLGYIGVICKPPDSSPQPMALSVLSRKNEDPKQNYEEFYLNEHKDVFDGIRERVGIPNLRYQLTSALEKSMAQSLGIVLSNVQDELAELKYSLKVEYSDRVISPEGYVSFLATSVKNGLESVARNYSRPKVKEYLRSVLHGRFFNVSEDIFWGETSQYTEEEKLHRAIAMLTKSGVGRITANSLVDVIVEQVKQIIKDGPLFHHPAAKERLLKQVELAMRNRCQMAVEQVENAIKPLKNDLEYTDEEWTVARRRTIKLLDDLFNESSSRLKMIQKEIGQKRLRKIVQQLMEMENVEDTPIPTLSINQNYIDLAKEAVKLKHQSNVLKQRIILIESDCEKPDLSHSNSRWGLSFLFGSGNNSESGIVEKTNQDVIVDEGNGEKKRIHIWNKCQERCPEVYLYLIMEKLLATATLYVHHEIVHEFLHPFPDELASSIPSSKGSIMGLDRTEILEFVQENPLVARHLQLQNRRRILEKVNEKLLYLQQQQQQQRNQ